MNQDDTDEQAFQEYLKGDSPLSSRYRKAATEQPPRALDNAILRAAHRDVESKPAIKYKRLFSNWRTPVSLAVVITLCVGLALTVHNEPEFFSGDPGFGVTQSQAPNDIGTGEFDQLANGVLPVPSEHFVAEEAEETPKNSSIPSPSDGHAKENLATINQRKITVKTDRLRVIKNFQKAVPAGDYQAQVIAPASPVVSKKSKRLGAQLSGKITQETATASAEPDPAAAGQLPRPEQHVIRAQASQNPDRKTATLNTDQQIAEIRNLWREGEKQKAEKQLKAFLKHNTNYDVKKLKRYLDSKFVDRVIKVLKK